MLQNTLLMSSFMQIACRSISSGQNASPALIQMYVALGFFAVIFQNGYFIMIGDYFPTSGSINFEITSPASPFITMLLSKISFGAYA